MTVPTPSSDNHSGAPGSFDSWTLERSGDEDAAHLMRPREELRDGALTLLAVTVLGLLLGVVWMWLAPKVPLFTDGKNVYLKDPEGEEAIGADGTFVLLALGFGAICGLVVFLRRFAGGIGSAVGLAVGGLLGSVVAWRFGVWLGPTGDVVAAAKQAGSGTTFSGPLELQAKAALLGWPIAGVLVYLLLVAGFGPRDPEPQVVGDGAEGGW